MGWGISPNAPENEKIKADMADYLKGLNSTGVIGIGTYDEAFEQTMKLLDQMYELGLQEGQKLNESAVHKYNHYYEIDFYEPGSEKEYSFYVASREELTRNDVVEKLKNEYLGVDGLQQEDLDHINAVRRISAKEFTLCCGKEAQTGRSKNRKRKVDTFG